MICSKIGDAIKHTAYGFDQKNYSDKMYWVLNLIPAVLYEVA